MILSDRTIREELAAGRIGIDPLDERAIRPSSADLRIDRFILHAGWDGHLTLELSNVATYYLNFQKDD